MKLIAASAALLASTYSAQSIETLIGQLVDKVYQHDPVSKTYTFNVSPYFNAVYTCETNGFTGEGTYGNGNGLIEYSERASWTDFSLDYELAQKGQVKSSPFNQLIGQFMEVPDEVLNDNFDGSMSFSATTDGIIFK